jgi:hypothetical protein
MRKELFVLSLLFLSSCGLYEENRRGAKYRLVNGDQVSVGMFELKYPLTQRRLMATVSEDYLKGKYCEDEGLRNLGDEIWAAIVRENNLSEINSGVLTFASNQGQATPYLCKYSYAKEKNGEWKKYDEWSIK